MLLQQHVQQYDPALASLLLAFASGAQQTVPLLKKVTRAKAGTTNSSGEKQLALDVAADEIFYELFKDQVHEYASEERESAIVCNPSKTYSISIDPLDGSSLVDVNLAVGCILGIWKGTVLEGQLVGAAYVVYGPTTILVYSLGSGVHEFVLQHDSFSCVQENMTLHEEGKIYSIGGLRASWTRAHTSYIGALEQASYKLRYSGGLVPDMHQILLKRGGLFSYPALTTKPEGKLRLLFELSPFAFLFEQAGGSATDGLIRILDVPRTTIHQRSPIYIGSTKEIEQAKTFLGGESNETTN